MTLHVFMSYRIVDSLAAITSGAWCMVIAAGSPDYCLIDVECKPYHHLYHHRDEQVFMNSCSAVLQAPATQ
jgi:hypothetical protein